MSDLKQSISQHEGEVGGKKKKRHCKRFWWVYLVAFLIIVVLVVTLVLLVAVPKIAQRKIDEAELTVQGIAITQTEEDSYNLAINSTITTDGSVHATIAAFDGVMYLEDLEPHTPFCTVSFPETSSDALQIVNVSQRVTIGRNPQFTTFNKWLLNNQTLRVTINGDTHVRVRGIARDYPVTFRKTITLTGLNKFTGINVTQASVSLGPDALGNNFRGWVDIPNPSILVIEIGNATFTNLLNGNEIGTTYIDNLVLRPGINNVTLRATIEQVPVLSAANQRPACETGRIPIALKGKSVVNRGQNLEYFASALAASEQTIDLNIGAALKSSLNITLQCPQN